MKGERRKAEAERNAQCGAAFLVPVVLALCLALGAQTAAAQLPNDPTRPPPGYDTAPAAGSEVEGTGAMTLQSVMISPTRKAAIISGVMVKLGEKYGDAVLIKVTENEVVLRSGNENQVLKLHPGVEKRDSASAKGAARDKARNAPSPSR
jgi:MSHA biogenesis protein MshK